MKKAISLVMILLCLSIPTTVYAANSNQKITYKNTPSEITVPSDISFDTAMLIEKNKDSILKFLLCKQRYSYRNIKISDFSVDEIIFKFPF
jgi:hypothetical protein